ncbi:hypothetical protein [Myxococcus phage Mx4 ts27htf-1hrm-1]|nr:hypothetical protein [Myxococcus phage Mx4 ts27htf-1hrm-1]
MSLTAEKIQELKSKHGDLRQLTAEGHTIVVRRPTEVEWDRHVTLMLDQQRRGQAPRALVETATVFPDKETLSALMTKMPGLASTFAAKIGEYVGSGLDVEKKDL